MVTPFKDTPPAIIRLIVFVAASFSLHAVTVGSFDVPGASTRSQDATNPRALHATLRPVRSSVDSSTPTDRSAFSAHSAESILPDVRGPHTGAATVSHTFGMRETGHGSAYGFIPNTTWYEGSEVDVRAEPLAPVELAYPVELEGTGIAGQLRVRLFIDERGVVIKAEIAASKPDRAFDKSALEGWRSARFTPARKNGVAVKSQKLLQLDFQP